MNRKTPETPGGEQKTKDTKTPDSKDKTTDTDNKSTSGVANTYDDTPLASLVILFVTCGLVVVRIASRRKRD